MMDKCDSKGLEHGEAFHHVNANSMFNLIQEQAEVKIISPSTFSFDKTSDSQDNLLSEANQENFDISLMNLPQAGDIAFDIVGQENDQLKAKHVFVITDFEIYEDGSVHVERLDAGSKAPHVSSRDFDSVDKFLSHYNGIGFVDTVDLVEQMNQTVTIERNMPIPSLPSNPKVIGEMAEVHFDDVSHSMNNYDKAINGGNSESYELITEDEKKAVSNEINREVNHLMKDGVFSEEDRIKLDDSVKKRGHKNTLRLYRETAAKNSYSLMTTRRYTSAKRCVTSFSNLMLYGAVCIGFVSIGEAKLKPTAFFRFIHCLICFKQQGAVIHPIFR